jgi:integrase
MGYKTDKELSPVQVRRLAGVGMHRVGGVKGLYLAIAPAGSKSWILRVTVGLKRRDIGLGGFPTVTLQMARDAAREAHQKIRQGVDPVSERRSLRASLEAVQAAHLTFREAARRCHAAKAPEFKNEKHRKEWITTLERHVFPALGNLAVAEITLPHVLKALEPIWHEKTETATRVRQRIEAVLTWSTVSGYRAGENPARWTGNLKEVLPNPGKISKVVHHPALPWQQIGKFMAGLQAKSGNSVRALEFAILTASRSGEVRGMTWDEIDFKAKLWTVPAGRIKAGKQHKVPLSPEALKILEAQPEQEDTPYVFPALRGGMLSDTALLMVVRRIGVDAVPHGFRSTFKDWARSCTAYADEVSELALAHVNDDKTRAAYARDELLPQREKLMKEWARFCRTLKKPANVVPFRKAKR